MSKRRVLELLIALELVATAGMKLVSVELAGAVLDVSDPILFAPKRLLLLAIAIVELAIAFAFVKSKNTFLKATSITWLIGVFTIYRLGMWIGGLGTCSCLGNGIPWWRWLDAHVQLLSWGAFIALFSLGVFYVTHVRQNPA